MQILEEKSVEEYLKKRNLIPQYKKVKNYLLAGELLKTSFKKRKPSSDQIYSFRINKKYRALCYFAGNTLRVFEINDHQ